MKLGTLNAWVTKQRDGRVSYDFGDGTKYVEANSYAERRILGLAKYFKGAHTFEEKCQVFNQVCDSIGEADKKLPLKDDGSLVIEDKTELATATISKLIDFFSEFEFEPNFRFINTLCYNCYSLSSAKAYVTTYFELTDNAYANAISDKMKSEEFKKIVDDFSQIAPSHKVNNRFKLYYGSAGTGKTTLAMKEAENCMVCHSAMLPSDLMEDFKFVDGKAEFIKIVSKGGDSDEQ